MSAERCPSGQALSDSKRVTLGGLLLIVLCVLLFLTVGLVVKASASRAEDPGFESRLGRDFSGSSHTSDLKFGTPVATLPGAWRYGISAGTGQYTVTG